MSDIEEPAAKISKIEEPAEGEEIDNGQEEWLSEEILTDEDYNAAADNEQSDSNANTSQEEGNADSMDQSSQDASNTARENIERSLNNIENVTQSVQQAELPEELGAFLIRKTDRRVVDEEQPIKEPESELDESTKQSEDDGNDTDDLLRMLGEDNSKKKEVATVQSSQSVRSKDAEHSSDEDDDEYIFEMSKLSAVSKLKGVRLDNKGLVRSRKMASKASTEDLSDPEEDSVQSSDEATTVKRMFDMHQSKVVTAGPRGLAPRRRGINAVKTVTKRVISIEPKNGSSVTLSAASNPVKSTVKLPMKPQAMFPMKAKPAAPPSENRTVVKKSASQDDMDEDFRDMESDGDEEGGQRLMQPERMDEEVPSDGDSHSDEDSYYDEMPSSESEDADDWFTLDIRTERATDYIPMLGEDAKALLTAEQQRAAARLGALRRSASALVAGRRSLAAQLRVARSSLAQLDAALAQ